MQSSEQRRVVINISLFTLGKWEITNALKVIEDSIAPGDSVTFDLSTSDLQKFELPTPSAVISLQILIKIAAEKTRNQVLIKTEDSSLRGFLNNINFSFVTGQYELAPERSDSKIQPQIEPFVNFMHLKNGYDIITVTEQLELLLYKWFPGHKYVKYRQSIRTAAAEICSNSIEHSNKSNSECIFMVQQYYILDRMVVEIAVADTGIGIKQHIYNKYGTIGNLDTDYILYAMEGNSGRPEGGGGMGLLRIQEITSDYYGVFRIQSGNGLISYSDKIIRTTTLNASWPGTQCQIILFPWRDFINAINSTFDSIDDSKAKQNRQKLRLIKK